MNNILDNIRIVLVEPSHNGNIGSVARAMLNMGLTDLWLVNPLRKIDDEAITLSCHAREVIHNAKIVPNLIDALDNINYVVGTSARVRKISLSIEPISIITPKIIERTFDNQKVAILFGREKVGLLNKELLMSNVHAYIPSNEGYTSLNLSQAVQVVAYEIFKQSVLYRSYEEAPKCKQKNQSATAKERHGLYNHFESAMIQSHFMNKSNSAQLLDKLKRLFQKTDLETEEINILRGFLSSINARKNI